MSVHRVHRTDATQKQIIAGLRSIPGMVVCLTTGVGLGFPDAILGWRGQTYLLELKSPGGALRGSQIMWLAAWKGGPVIHAETLSDVLHALGIAAT